MGVAFSPAKKPTPSATMAKTAANRLAVLLKVRRVFLR